ncbi:helix-turn-helix domain-containing protein [Palleronia sp.]|uniref:helix-turn-helix domain-containing protein n=1 Tax=Palleronia sp. TaxID=1940284 RepID=UPI0035C7A4A7
MRENYRALFLFIFSVLPIRTHLPVMSKTLSNLRKTAARRAAMPVLTVPQIAKRWRLDPDTVRPILRARDIPKAPGPWRHPRYAFMDILRLEGVQGEQLERPEDFSDLSEKLMTATELAEQFVCVPATIRNWAAQDLIPSIRLGGSIRFRRSDVLGPGNAN